MFAMSLCGQHASSIRLLLTGSFANSLTSLQAEDKLIFVALLANMCVYASRHLAREHIWVYNQFDVVLLGRANA